MEETVGELKSRIISILVSVTTGILMSILVLVKEDNLGCMLKQSRENAIIFGNIRHFRHFKYQIISCCVYLKETKKKDSINYSHWRKQKTEISRSNLLLILLNL